MAVPGYGLQFRTWLYFIRQGLAMIYKEGLAIVDKAVPCYDLQGRTKLYLVNQGLAMIYNAGPG